MGFSANEQFQRRIFEHFLSDILVPGKLKVRFGPVRSRVGLFGRCEQRLKVNIVLRLGRWGQQQHILDTRFELKNTNEQGLMPTPRSEI